MYTHAGRCSPQVQCELDARINDGSYLSHVFVEDNILTFSHAKCAASPIVAPPNPVTGKHAHEPTMSVCDSARRRLRQANTLYTGTTLHSSFQDLNSDPRRFPYRTTLRSSSQQLARVRAQHQRGGDPPSNVISNETQTTPTNLHPATTDDQENRSVLQHTRYVSSPSTTVSTGPMNGSAIRTYTHEAMMRNKPASSMQKTYDECYLICSTAVYFEGQV